MLLGFAGVFAAGFAIIMGFGLEEALGVVTLVGVVALLVKVLTGLLRENARGWTPVGNPNSDAQLKWIIMENTILFKDIQIMQFPERGSYFMIGPNGSGKSSVFELIRRCLGSTKNNSFSSFFNKEEMAYVICGYKVDDDKHIFSATFGIHHDQQVKFACELVKYEDVKYSDPDISSKAEEKGVKYEVMNFGIDDVYQREHGLQRHKLKCSSDLIVSLMTYIEKIVIIMNGEASVNEYIHKDINSIVVDLKKCVNTVVSNYHVTHGTTTDSCDDILEALDTKVVHIFSAGAIGTLQWSESKRMALGYREDNYQSACNNAEILTWYLQTKDQLKEKEINTVEGYYQTLTDGSKIEFSLGGSPLKIIVKDDNGEVALLKLSEGILEAMKFAIILGIDRFKTILYEDPERGMHPQMIQRMRDLILRNITKKTILITSHHPALTTFWNLNRVFLFRVTKGAHKSAIVKTVPEDFSTDSCECRFLSSMEYSSIFYAERIIFVEGPSDALFVFELKDLLIKTIQQGDAGPYSGRRDGLCKCLNANETDLKRFMRFLIGLEIIPAMCIGNLSKFETICESFLIDYFTLKDNDAVKWGIREDRTKTDKEVLPKADNVHATAQKEGEVLIEAGVESETTQREGEVLADATGCVQDTTLEEGDEGADASFETGTSREDGVVLTDAIVAREVTPEEVCVVADASVLQETTHDETSNVSYTKDTGGLPSDSGGKSNAMEDTHPSVTKGSTEENIKTEFKWGNGELEDVVADFTKLHDSVCLECKCRKRESDQHKHDKLTKSAKKLVGCRKNQPGKKMKPYGERSHVEDFLDEAFDILVNGEETYKTDLGGRQILDFIKFLFDHAIR